MTADFYRWEVDPFFSAAEDVQDSADRMESAHRTWLHDQSLAKANPTDMELANVIELRRRELLIALGTTKWQLEDFERAVKVIAPNCKVLSAEDSSSRHMQFIVAIQNQIASIEKALQDAATNNGDRSLQWVDLDEQERDDLAIFLSGPSPRKSSVEHSICRSITEQQVKENPASLANSQETEDMVASKLDDISLLPGKKGWSKSQRHPTNDGTCVLGNFGNGFTKSVLMSRDSDLGMELSHRVSESRDDWHTGWSTERASGHKRSASAGAEFEAWKVAIADNDGGERSHDSGSENLANRLNIWGLLRNLNFLSKLKVARSGMKRWKDGESSTMDEKLVLPSANGVLNTWVGYNDTVFNGCRLPSYSISDDKPPNGWTGNIQRMFQRSQYFIQYSHLCPVRIVSAVLVILGLLGLFTFNVT
uniref:Syntaxin 6/10/61 N-terminal domain-containing protein n=1 Tax=Araucaria cunninghamii TaxID=56994 RepID=A0A0D6R0Z5_ARACU